MSSPCGGARLWLLFAVAVGAAPKAEQWRLVCIADLDKTNRVGDKKPKWKSMLQLGTLSRSEDSKYSVAWDANQVDLWTSISETGRGGEFSELAEYNGELLTIDDRSGALFALPPASFSRANAKCSGKSEDHWALPRHIFTEGDGSVAKGLKAEWATVKDGDLFVGSFGKPFTTPDGARITSNGTLWIARLTASGSLIREDWTPRYRLLNEATNSVFPGYMIVEAVEWEPISRRWVIMPRRLSPDGAVYDEVLDEQRGTDVVLWVDEEWTKVVEQKRVGTLIPARGASSFKFIPGTNGRVMALLKTEEEEAKGTQATYFSVIDLDTGAELLKETPLPLDRKFEGIMLLPHEELPASCPSKTEL